MSTTDAQLVHRCLEGDLDAFSSLVKKYQDAVYGLALSYVRDFNVAQDIAQEAFIKTYLQLPTLRDPSKFGSYLRTTVANLSKNYLGRRRLHKLSIDQLDENQISSFDQRPKTPSEVYEQKELRELVMKAIGRLSEKNRQTVTLYYIDGLSCQEIGNFLGVPVAVVKQRLHRARELLKEEIMEMVSETLKSRPLPKEFARKVAEEAKRYEIECQWEKAMEKYRQAVKANPEDFNSRLYVARICYRQGLYDEAIQMLEEMAKMEHEDCTAALASPSRRKKIRFYHPWTQITLGWCWDALGQREKAVAQYRKALDLVLTESAAKAALLGLEAPHPPKKKVPKGPTEDEEISPEGWKARASHNSNDAFKAFDRDFSTRWMTLVHQRPGMWFELDIGKIHTICRILLDDDGGGTSIYISDYPRKYVVEISKDGSIWKKVASGEGHLDEYVSASFEPTKARFIRITQKGYCSPEFWSIYEIFVYKPKE